MIKSLKERSSDVEEKAHKQELLCLLGRKGSSSDTVTCLNVNCSTPYQPWKIEKPVITAEFLILYPFSFVFVL